MDSSNEFNRKNEIEDYLYDVKENIDNSTEDRIEMHSLIADSGDVIDCSNNIDENLQSSIKSQLAIRQSIDFLFKHDEFDDKQNIILSEKIDVKESSPSQLSIYNKSQDMNPITEYSYENNQNPISPLFMYQLSLFDLEYNTTSTSLVLPQLIQNHIKSSNSFQQLWSPRVYSPKLIDSNKSESTLSILWSLIILLAKLIITVLKILRYDAILFSLCYLLGALFGMNAYYFIDFLLILTCIISIFMATYEKWLFRYISLIEYDTVLSNTYNENRYWKKIKLVAYGLVIGTISTFII